MTSDPRITVQLCIDDAPLRRRVADCLAAGQLSARAVDAAEVADIDVQIADHAVVGDAEATIGRVHLGEGDSRRLEVDAVLPVDFLDREFVLVCQLVAQMARLRRQLASGDTARRMLLDQALTDPTTTLPNRRGWEEQLTQTLARCREREEHLSVAVLDLDHFKRINDTFGHAAGDEVLRRVGLHLAEALRKGDIVARLGGDEFAVLLPGLGPENADAVVDRIRRGVSDVDLDDLVVDTRLSLTASAGYVCISPEYLTDTPEAPPNKTILDAADRAMYGAKGAGRDCTQGGER